MRVKLSSISFLILLIAPALITFSFFQCRRLFVRNEVRNMIIEGVEKEDLVLLEFTRGEALTDIRWEHEKEFEYNAQMYDIVETIVAGNIIYYWCWWDKDETELKRQLGELGNKVFNTDPQKREKNDLLYNFYKSLFFAGRENLHLTLQPVTVKQRSLYCAHTVSSHFQPPTPPPRKS